MKNIGKTSVLVLLGLVLPLMGLQAAESLSEPVIRIGKMAKAPVIDGVITKAMTLRSFTAEEVAELYRQHSNATGQVFEPGVAALAYEYSRGQPYLVNALARWCMDEIHDRRFGEPITLADMHEAKEKIIREMALGKKAMDLGVIFRGAKYAAVAGICRFRNSAIKITII